MKSSPAWTPAALRSHPTLLVEWLRFTNLLSRWREQGAGPMAAVFGAMAIVTVLLAALSVHAATAIEVLAEYWMLTATVAAIYATTTVSQRRRRIEDSQSQSWLVATPIAQSSARMSHAIRTVLPLLALLLGLTALFVSVALLSDGVGAAAGTVIAAVSGGFSVGGLAGWHTGRKREKSESVASRYVPHPRAQAVPRPDSAALSHWPVAQVLSWSRPENSRHVLVVALFAVQGSSSAIAGLSVIAMYFVVSYLVGLWSATLTVGKLAAAWLRATPMTLGEFVWVLSRRALVHQVAGAILAVACMLLLGAPIAMALQAAAVWLSLAISISGVALVDRYRGRSPAVKIALTLVAFAALATTMQLRAGAKA